MFTNNTKHMEEVEQFIKNEREHEVQLDSFVTISGIKGRQFGKDVFTAVLPFKDLMKFLEVFPEVQRKMNRNKVLSIKRYVLTGLTNENAMRFFPAITATARGHVFYDENTQKIAIDALRSKLSINDGQHRFFGINEAIRELNGQLNKEPDHEERHRILDLLKELNNMVIPLVIFSNISEIEEKQLFHDTNNLASRPSRSATIRLNQTDLISKMARELAEENKYLKYYGVEFDKMSIQLSNPNLILLTTVYAGIKLLLHKQLKENREFINTESYSQIKEGVDLVFSNIFLALPPDVDNKQKYIISKSYALKGICSFCNLIWSAGIEEQSIYDAIEKVDWTLNTDFWGKYRGVITKRGQLSFGGSGDHGRIAVIDALIDKLPESEKIKLEAFQNKRHDPAPDGQTELVFN